MIIIWLVPMIDVFLPGVIQELREDVHGKRGQPKLEALAKLVILLDSNGLLEVRGEGLLE